MARRTLSLRGAVRARDMRAGIAALAAGDPDFASVVLLLDFAGADEAQDITDLSSSAKTETFVGLDTKVDTTLQYLGVNSLEVAGTSYVTYADHADWDLPGDFTIECGLRWPAANSSRAVISTYTASDGWALQPVNKTEINFIAMGSEQKSEAVTIAGVTWYHVAIVRSSGSLYLFLDGVQKGTPTAYATSITGTETLKLGLLATPNTQMWTGGYIGAVRITKGVARYTANFTPPSAFYPTS